MNFTHGVEQAWANFMTFMPKLLLFAGILLLGYWGCKIIARLFDRVLERVGFDRLVERGGIKSALAKTRYDASDLLSKLLFYTAFLFVLQLAFGVFGPNPVSDLLTRVIAFLPSIFVAIVIVVIASAIAKGVKDILSATLGGLSYGRIVANIASLTILIIGIFAALNQVGIAPAIVNGLFYAMLAIVVGSSVIAIGGGGIQPMRAQWEKAISRMHAEAPRIREQMEQAPQRAQETAEQYRSRLQTAGNGQSAPEPRPYAQQN
ncbi:MAG: hypothetical protein SFY81_02285 [Verrucomicrobiota bacterium]|nr:hypothetical protein [Verrucomicrobiota bacterium]